MTSKKGGQVTMQLTPERHLILAIEEAITGATRKDIVYSWIDRITPAALKSAKDIMDRQDTRKLNFSLTKNRNDWINELAEVLEISRHRVLTLIVDAISIDRARVGENP